MWAAAMSPDPPHWGLWLPCRGTPAPRRAASTQHAQPLFWPWLRTGGLHTNHLEYSCGRGAVHGAQAGGHPCGGENPAPGAVALRDGLTVARLLCIVQQTCSQGQHSLQALPSEAQRCAPIQMGSSRHAFVLPPSCLRKLDAQAAAQPCSLHSRGWHAGKSRGAYMHAQGRHAAHGQCTPPQLAAPSACGGEQAARSVPVLCVVVGLAHKHCLHHAPAKLAAVHRIARRHCRRVLC